MANAGNITKRPGDPGFGVDMSKDEILEFMNHKKPAKSDKSKKFSKNMADAMISNLNNKVAKTGFRSA